MLALVAVRHADLGQAAGKCRLFPAPLREPAGLMQVHQRLVVPPGYPQGLTDAAMRPAEHLVILGTLPDLEAALVEPDSRDRIAAHHLEPGQLVQRGGLRAVVALVFDEAERGLQAFPGPFVITKNGLDHSEPDQRGRLPFAKARDS